MAGHRNIIVRAIGLAVMVVGLQKTAWVVYNVFIDPGPAFAESNALAVGTGLIIGVLMVMLGGLLFAWRKPQEQAVNADGLTPGVEETVRELVNQGRRSEAIEAYRAATGTSHPDAEVAVTRISAAA